jgi:hypothetical protein
LGELLVLTRHIRRAAGIGVKRRLRHLRPEFIKAALKRSEIGKVFHEMREARGDLRIARAAGCDWMAAIDSRGDSA